MNKPILMYATTWCGDCKRAKHYLDSRSIPYTYINIEEDESAMKEVLRINNGNQSVPTIIFPNGTILVEPSNQELEKALLDVDNKTGDR